MAGPTILRVLSKLVRELHRQNRSGFERFSSLVRRPLFVYTIIWTIVLAAVVTVASVTQELAFSTTVSPFSQFSRACRQEMGEGKRNMNESVSNRTCFRVALDRPGDVLCLPAHLFKKSIMDYVIPPIFATIVVGASACFVQAMGLWNI